MLRGLRFQKRLRVLPGVRINLSKSGASASIGPRGADVNIGRDGITTNAGIPGTGLSYRTKLKPGGFLIGVVALVIGLGFATYKNMDSIAAWLAPTSPPPVVAAAAPTPTAPTPTATAPKAAVQDAPARPARTSVRAQAAKLLVPGGTIYVRRAGSVLRETEKPSGKALRKLDKGAAVTVVAVDADWTQVKADGVTGWMRTSVLGPKP